ncbi:lon protease like, mitochondrial [Pyronema domesticum]|nr:lon protease like, mitochondrial [Pyronema domesticum]
MAYGSNFSRSAARLSRGQLRTTPSRQLPAASRSYTCLNALPRTTPASPLSQTRIAAQSPRLLSIRRDFTSTALRLKDQPPEDKDIVEEEIEEETKRKQEAEKKKKPVEEETESEVKVDAGNKNSSSRAPPAQAPKGGAAAGGAAGSSGDNGDILSGGRRASTTSSKALQKNAVPEMYPRVMALPIARRPLFPGFYKAVTIKDQAVADAIQEMLKRGQPYVGAFLFKDEEADGDTIQSLDEVHEVGVFAQVTSAFPAQGDETGLTAVLYPHRRIKITNLLPRGAEDEPAQPMPEAEIEEITEEFEERQEKGDVVASFEEPTEVNRKSVISSEYATSFLKKFDISMVEVENLPEEKHDKKDPVIRAVTQEIVSVFKDLAQLNPLFRDQIATFSMTQSAGSVIEEPAKLADFAAAVSSGEVHELQEVLQTMNVADRLQKALVVLKKEVMNAQLQSKISKDVEAKIQKRQREYWLLEQMKGIKRELGIESDGKEKLVEKFREKAAKLSMPEAVKKVFDEELNKLSHLEPAASEFNVTRNYLDWLTQIPWGQRSTENYSIGHAMKVLEEDHYGLKDVKERILEFIAVGKLRGTVEGKIICFVGPPGVGKTSIGKSIARALNRQFYRFSVGGLTDVAEIKGHRRTYVGALPGRIIQALKKCQTENPLVLIDEVDKIGRGHQGDPASALLELLDPEQNSSFLDHYLDVPVDLSKVLFVCTANMTDTIPQPLLDRMEMIQLSGYVADEKMAIAEKYLAPQAKELSGLKDVDVQLQQDAIEELIKSYCRESGVRNLKKQIEKVYRKSALKIVQDLGEEALPEEKAITEEGKTALENAEKDAERIAESADPAKTEPDMASQTSETPRVSLEVPKSVHVNITKDNLKDYVGPPVFRADRLYDIPPPGVIMGLAWTQMGGAALYVESILEAVLSASGRPGLERTGSLRDVMKESAVVAYSFVKGLMARDFPENRFFEHAKVHLHCPEGAVPKDGKF